MGWRLLFGDHLLFYVPTGRLNYYIAITDLEAIKITFFT